VTIIDWIHVVNRLKFWWVHFFLSCKCLTDVHINDANTVPMGYSGRSREKEHPRPVSAQLFLYATNLPRIRWSLFLRSLSYPTEVKTVAMVLSGFLLRELLPHVARTFDQMFLRLERIHVFVITRSTHISQRRPSSADSPFCYYGWP
jgi:hypothetical protein